MNLTQPALLLAMVVLASCAVPERQEAVPLALTEKASVLGIPNERFWPDSDGQAMVEEAQQALRRENSALGGSAPLGDANYLAVSGGSDDGAFGAGLLVGWSENGTRPNFKVVTGISTGALTAPFAFLGSGYDQQLREVFTDTKQADIFEHRWLPTAVFRDALADTSPLYRLISRYANEDMLAAIAREYGKGRLLLIGTTDLDMQRPVIWNIGAIAASGRPGALELFRKVLLASASIPGVFPPVLINSSVDGHHYQELHVDGGVVLQTFLIPPQIGLMMKFDKNPTDRERHAYIIRNSQLSPDWASVDRRVLDITGRAISSMIHYSGYNDVMRIYATCQRDHIDFNLAYIRRDFKVEKKESFDPVYMQALFDDAYRQGKQGYRWNKTPPILVGADGEAPATP